MNDEQFTFAGRTYQEMVEWLGDHKVDVVNFDKVALKPLHLLWRENRKEVVLRWDAENERVLRVARTVRIVLLVGDSILRETVRVYPKGKVKKDDWWSMSETLYKKERAPTAAIRGLWQECHLKVAPHQLDVEKWAGLAGEPPEPYRSSTYPGIWTCAIPEWIEIRLEKRPWEDPPIVHDHGVLIYMVWDNYRPPTTWDIDYPPTEYSWLLK